MLDPEDYWRDKAITLLGAIAGHFAPASTSHADLENVMEMLRASPSLRDEVTRILDMRWSGNNAAFDDFLYAMERAQRYDGATYRWLLHLMSGRRLERNNVKATARTLLRSLAPDA